MTRQLDLRSGRPVWMAYRAPRVGTSTLASDLRAEVLVVGMGISGAMLAEALTAAGRKVVMIDRRGPMQGSTPATTALVQFEIDQPLTRLTAQIGRERAERAWIRSRLAVANLKARVEQLGLNARMVPRPSLYLAGDLMDGDALRDEAAARAAAGIAARYLDARTLREDWGFDRPGAILSHDNLELDPRRLTAGLLNLAAARGARLLAPVEATGLVHHADRVEVPTAGGPVITAEQVVLATGYELLGPVPAQGHSVISTWAMATRPQPRRIWPGRALIWEASAPYLYLRATPDGRVICGGEDEPFQDEVSRDALTGEKIARIAEKLGRLLPGLDTTPDFAWGAAFGATETGLPRIGALPRRPRVQAVMGYGGNGITYSQLASEIVSTALAGGEDRDTDLFALKPDA